jgi:hypothetical protein
LLAHPAGALDNVSKNLAFCSGVFAYAANYYLIFDNEGAARVMLFQQARSTTTLFSLHYRNGAIKGERAAEFRAEERKVKPLLDSNPDLLANTVDECVSITTKYAAIQSGKNIEMWGLSFYDVVNELAAKLRGTLGL